MKYVTPKYLIERNLMTLFNVKDDSGFIFSLSTTNKDSGVTLTLRGITYYLVDVSEMGGDTKFLNFYPYFSLKFVDTIVEPAL